MACQSEVQSISIIGATGGTCDLEFDGQIASGVAWNADASAVQSALEGLSNIAPGDVSVSGGPFPSSAMTVDFSGGTYSNQNVAQISVDPTNLTGTKTASVSTTTDGVPAGSGFGVRGYWKLDETGLSEDRVDQLGVYDLSPNATVSYDSGKISNALAMDNGDYVASYLEASFPKMSQDVSFWGWFRMSSGTSALNASIARIRSFSSGFSVTGTLRFDFYFSGGSGGIYAAASDGGANSASVFKSISSYSSWYFLAATWDASAGELKFYVDGALVGSDTAVLDDDSSSAFAEVRLEMNGGASKTFLYDEWGMSDVVLSSTQVSDLYNAGSGVTYPEDFSSGTDEVQSLTESGAPSEGTFTLSFTHGGNTYTTAAISYNASASEVQTALRALPNIGSNGVVCTGGSLPGAAITITFQGTLAATNVNQLVPNSKFLQCAYSTTTQGGCGGGAFLLLGVG